MEVASRELCEELYRLSNWHDTQYCYPNQDFAASYGGWHDDHPEYIPAYPLGFLLRKLPAGIEHDCPNDLEVTKEDDEKYWASYTHVDDDIITASGETPENALCCLAILLHKQGILKPQEPK